MTKKIDNSILKAAILLIHSGNNKEAELLLGKFSEKDFIESLKKENCNENMTLFISKFKKPNWELYLEIMNVNDVLKFLSNIDNLKVEDKEPLLSIVLNNLYIRRESINKNNIKSIFSDVSDELFQFLLKTDGEKVMHLIFYAYLSDSSASKEIFKKLNDIKYVNSDSYNQLFSKPNEFIKALFDQRIETINNFINESDDSKLFFINKKDILLSNKIIDNLFIRRNVSDQIIDFAENLISTKNFNPDYNLFNEEENKRIKKAYLNSLDMSSKSVKLFNLLLTNNHIDVNSLNNSINYFKIDFTSKSFSFYEGFIKDFLTIKFNDKESTLSYLKLINSELDLLNSYGLNRVLNSESKVSYNEKIDDLIKKVETNKNKNRGFGFGFEFDEGFTSNVGKDVMQFSSNFGFPPYILEELIKVLDKRYNYQAAPIKDDALITQEIKSLWNEIIDKSIDLSIVTPKVVESKDSTENPENTENKKAKKKIK